MPRLGFMLTAGEYVDLMEHALGRTPDSRHNLWKAFNRAGSALVTEHLWKWRQNAEALVPTVSGQSQFPLPDDFLSHVSIVDNAGGYPPTLTTKGDIERNRTNSLASSAALLVCLDDTITPAGHGPTRPAGAVWPLPTANGSPTFRLVYLRGWRDINEGDENAIPNPPKEFQDALLLRCRFQAKLIENDSASAGVASELAAYQNEVNRLKNEEATRQMDHGRMIGGAARVNPNEYPGSPNIVTVYTATP